MKRGPALKLGERRLFSARELPFFAGILLALGMIWLLLGRSPQGTQAVVEAEGQEVLRRELTGLIEPERIQIAGAEGVSLTVELSPQGARVLSASCPDKICQRAGLLTKAGESAVCLPGRVVLRLEGPGAPADAVTY